MSRWGNRSEQTDTDFPAIIEQHRLASQLLKVNHFVQAAKNNSKFTHIILQENYKYLLYDFLQIAINPKRYQIKNNTQIDTTITHNAIQIISNLNEQYIEAVFESQTTNTEDQVVQHEKEYPILMFIFRQLEEENLELTGLAYFSKIIILFIYRKITQVLSFVENHCIPTIVKHFQSSAIVEVASKLIEADGEKDFFEEEKVRFCQKLCRELSKVDDPTKIQGVIESFAEFIFILVERHEDKYQKERYELLINKIIENGNMFIFLIENLQKFNNRLLRAYIFKCISSLLRLHLMTKCPEEKYIKMNQQLQKAIRTYILSHKVSDFVSDIRFQLVEYFKMLREYIPTDIPRLHQIITSSFIKDSLQIMEKDANNNVLHNYFKQTIIYALTHSQEVKNTVTKQFDLQFVTKYLINSRNSKNSFENLIFLIVQKIRQPISQSQENEWTIIDKLIISKRQFFQTKIAYIPNDDFVTKWYNYRVTDQPEKSNNQAQSGKQIQQIGQSLTMSGNLQQLGGNQVLSQDDDFTEEKNNQDSSKSNHYYDFELPLDSDKQDETDQKKKAPVVAQFSQVKEKELPLNSPQKSEQTKPVFESITQLREEMERLSLSKYGINLRKK